MRRSPFQLRWLIPFFLAPFIGTCADSQPLSPTIRQGGLATLQGKVEVVTEDGQKLKLQGVEIRVFSSNSVARILATRNAEAPSKLEQLQQARASAKDRVDRAVTRQDTLRKELQAVQKSLRSRKAAADKDADAIALLTKLEKWTDDMLSPMWEYRFLLTEAIQSRWMRLQENQPASMERSGKAVAKFQLHPDGSVSGLRITGPDLDEARLRLCERAILQAAPFGKWPSEALRQEGKEPQETTFTFNYWGETNHTETQRDKQPAGTTFPTFAQGEPGPAQKGIAAAPSTNRNSLPNPSMEAVRADLEASLQRVRGIQTVAYGLWAFRRAAERELERCERALQDFPDSGFYLEGFDAPPLATSSTDAEGRFTLQVPADEPLVGLASTSTESAKGKEAYLWFLRLPPAAKAKPLVLNNRNLATARNPANVLDPPLRKLTGHP